MPIRYTDPTSDVPPGVDFLDAAQVRTWVSQCEVDKPWRQPMRQRLANLVSTLPSGARVLELGSGPGHLAESVMEACPNVQTYTLLDFSGHMLDLGRERVSRFGAAQFIQADFRTPAWCERLSPPYSAVIAMQAVHEIRHKRHVPGLYRQVRDLLEPGGLFAVCDGVPRDTSVLFQVNLFMTAQEQLEAFASAGFERVTLEDQIGPIVLVTGRVARRIADVSRRVVASVGPK